MEELEEWHKVKDSFYEAKRIEMKGFKEMAEKFVVNCEKEVEKLRNGVNEVTENHSLMECFCYSSFILMIM